MRDYPDHIVAVLLERGFKSGQIGRMRPTEAVRECVAWELGSSRHADFIVATLRSCGFTIEPEWGKNDG